MAGRLAWKNDEEFSLDGVSYQAMARRTASDQMVVLKPRRVIELYEALIRAENPRSIVELGIYGGASTALLAQLANPDKFVAIDVRDSPIAALEEFLDARNLRDRVSAHYGVDQADVAKLGAIVRQEFKGAPLDAVIDDASHLADETRASFNCLFPHLRPGASYIIEDWSWPHQSMPFNDSIYCGVTPISAFVVELALVSGCSPDVIADITLQQGWALVHRGRAALDSNSFDVSGYLDDLGREMVAALASTRTAS